MRGSKTQIRKLLAETEVKACRETAYCLTPDCGNKVIANCHVIGKGSQLTHIAEKGRCSWIKPSPSELMFRPNRRIWRSDPISKILTFRGFCAECDGSIFQEIDQPLAIEENSLRLLAYRSFCYIYWWSEVNRKKDLLLADNGGPPLRSLPPLFQPASVAIRNREEEHEYCSITERAVIADLQGGKTLRTRVYRLTTNLGYLYSCAVPLNTDLLCNGRGLNWKVSLETPRWYVHLLRVDDRDHIIFSWDPKFDEQVEELLHFFEALDGLERGLVMFQKFCLENMGFACSPTVARTASNAGFEGIEERIRDGQGHNKLHEIPIAMPSDDLTVPHIEVDKVLDFNARV